MPEFLQSGQHSARCRRPNRSDIGGSSAIYGSDAVAGVINIILKKNFEGFEASAKYGSASGTDEVDGSFALGKRWDKVLYL